MDWFWRQRPTSESQNHSASALPATADIIPTTPSDSKPDLESHSAAEAAPQVEDRDAAAYEELKALFSQINPEIAAQAAEIAKNGPKVKTVEELERYTQSLYPSTMNCAQCFDMAYYCSSVGGQLNNLYRYGGLRSCTDLWKQWRFCMRTKAMPAEVKKDRIREFNMKKVIKYKTGNSSEDIWEVREEPIGDSFMNDPQAADEKGGRADELH